MARVTIRKVGDRWVSVRPGYGFAARDQIRAHATWRAAIRAAEPRGAAGYADTERRPQTDYDGAHTAS